MPVATDWLKRKQAKDKEKSQEQRGFKGHFETANNEVENESERADKDSDKSQIKTLRFLDEKCYSDRINFLLEI